MIARLENASFHHGATPVLRNVNASIELGKFICLLGANGAGKTTLIRLVTGEVVPTEGRVSLVMGGDPVARSDTYRNVATVPQNVQDPPYVTVRELVELGRFHPRKGLGWRLSSKDKDIVDASLDTCDLLRLAERPFTKISGGEKQRAWLAFCLAQQKDLLVLDESLQGVDYFSKQFFFGLLKDIATEGKGVVLTTHDIDLAARFADKVLILRDGALVYDGPPADDLASLLANRSAA